MEIWYFRCHCEMKGLGTNEISYIFYLRHMTTFRRKQNVHIFIQVSKHRNRRNIKKRDCRAVFRTLANICDQAFLRKYNS